MGQLINDVLKPTGKWSIKRIMAVIVLFYVLFLGTFIVVSDKILEREVNRYAIDVFNSLLAFEAILLGLTEFGKRILDKFKPKEE